VSLPVQEEVHQERSKVATYTYNGIKFIYYINVVISQYTIDPFGRFVTLPQVIVAMAILDQYTPQEHIRIMYCV